MKSLTKASRVNTALQVIQHTNNGMSDERGYKMVWVNVEDTFVQQPSQQEIEEIERYSKLKKTKAKFYTDENFQSSAIKLLRERGFDVLTAQEANKLGHPDQNHLAEAKRLGRVLLTCDRDYLNDRIYPLIHCPTIVVFDFGLKSKAEMISAFQCLAYVASFPQFFDKWCKIEAKPGEWIERLRFLDGTSSRERLRFFHRRIQVWKEN